MFDLTDVAEFIYNNFKLCIFQYSGGDENIFSLVHQHIQFPKIHGLLLKIIGVQG